MAFVAQSTTMLPSCGSLRLNPITAVRFLDVHCEQESRPSTKEVHPLCAAQNGHLPTLKVTPGLPLVVASFLTHWDGMTPCSGSICNSLQTHPRPTIALLYIVGVLGFSAY